MTLRSEQQVAVVFPGGLGGCCHIWAIQVCAAVKGFQAVYSGIGYINQRVWV